MVTSPFFKEEERNLKYAHTHTQRERERERKREREDTKTGVLGTEEKLVGVLPSMVTTSTLSCLKYAHENGYA